MRPIPVQDAGTGSLILAGSSKLQNLSVNDNAGDLHTIWILRGSRKSIHHR